MSALLPCFARALGQLAACMVLRTLARSVAAAITAFVAVARAGWHAIDAALAWLGIGATSATHLVHRKREA